MADEVLYNGIVNIDVYDNNAPERLQEIFTRLRAVVQGAGDLEGGSDIGQGVSRGLKMAEQDIERYIRHLQELRTAQGALLGQQGVVGGDMGTSQRIAEIDALITKMEQLRRVQALPAQTAHLSQSDREIAASEQRAQILRENARLQTQQYGGGLAGMRATDAITGANARVSGADAAITKAQEQLARAMQDRAAAEAAAGVISKNLAKAEADLAEATGRREGYLQLLAVRGIREGGAPAELELNVRKQEQRVNRDRAVIDELGQMQRAADMRIKTAKDALAAAEERRAAAAVRAETIQESQNAAARKRAAAEEAEAARRAEAARLRGDPRRSGILSQDPDEFLAAAGIERSGSLRMQELQIEEQRLVASRASLVAKIAAAEDDATYAKLIDQRISVERRISANTAAQERQRFLETGRGGFAGGLLGRHDGSPEGVRGADLGFQAGQAVKYFALYSVMSAVTQSVSQLVSISAEYSLAVTDLAVAMNTSTAEAKKAAEEYSAIGAEYGTGPLESLQGASKFRRTFRDPVTQESEPGAGETGARVASYINVLEGPQRIEKVMQDLISLMRAYGQPATGAPSVYDQTQSIAQLYGYQSGEVVGGAAALADLGKESGYSLPELVALIASVMQQTGTTSDAAAGDVKRILGSQDSPEMNQAFERYGINLDLSFKDRLDALSKVIEKMNPQERSRAITDLSADPRTGAVRAAILTAIPGARDAVANAQDSTGLVDRQVKQRLGELGGELKQLQANFTQAVLAIGDTGITQLLTLLAHNLNAVASVVVDLANLLDGVPDPIKQTVAGLGALLLTLKAISATRNAFAGSEILRGIGSGGASAAATSASLAQLQAQRGLAIATGQSTTAITAQITALERQAAANLTFTGRVTAMGSAAARAAGPLAIIAGILTAFTMINDANQARKTGESAAATALDASNNVRGMTASNADPERVRAEIARLEQSRKDIKSTGDGFVGWMMDFGTRNTEGGGTAGNRQKILDAIDGRIKQAKATLDAIDAKVAALTPAEFERGTDKTQEALFGADMNRVPYGIEAIKRRGLSARSGTESLEYLVNNASLDKLFPQGDEAGVSQLIDTIVQKIGRGTDPLQQQADYGRLRQVVSELQTKAGSDPNQADAVQVLVEQANRLYLDSLISNTQARIANIKATQEEGPKAKAQINKLITAALNQTTALGDVGATVSLLNQVDQNFLRAYRRNIEAQRRILIQQLEAIKKALVAARNAARIERESAGIIDDHFTRMDESNPDPAKLKAQEDAQKQIDAYNQMLRTLGRASGQTSYDNTATKWDKPEGPTAEEIEMARIAAQARPGDPYSQAKTNLQLARYQLKNAENKKEYWDALKQLHDAQYELAMVELEQASNARLLASDVTDPVAQARVAVQAAKDKLAYDRNRGASGTVITGDRLALKQAQAQAASASWSQQFGDMQTNYELNRISLSAYLKYLNSQKAYLEAVKNKTRDQVEQLNQVDRALKGLAEGLQGQWNLGDIKMPTAYEMRRAVAGYAGGGQNQTYITINGANMAQVMQVLQAAVGTTTISAAPTTPVKV